MLADPTLPEVVPYAKLHRLLQVVALAIGRNTAAPEIVHFPNEARFTLVVHPKDQGRFVGKAGSTIWAIQTLLYFAGLAQIGYSYTVKLIEPDFQQKDDKPLRFNPNWPRQRIRELVDAILSTCIPCHAKYTLSEPTETIALINLTITKYLRINLNDPNFADAIATVLKTAGMSNGVNIKTETIFA
jgi:predicted RNA-binding protein YlqC (UPF0109 family)